MCTCINVNFIHLDEYALCVDELLCAGIGLYVFIFYSFAVRVNMMLLLSTHSHDPC